MKKLLFSAFCFIIFVAKSQTHRFIYDVEYRKDSTQNLTTKENYNLDIDAGEVKYYTRDYFTADSLIANNIPFPKDITLNPSNIVTHKRGTSLFNDYDLIEGNTVLKLQSEDVQSWKLTEEKKKIKNVNLQKATTCWGGRNWIAWFAAEIPFQEGPYKFHGLPGLIVEVYDDKNNYRFELVKSQKLDKPSANEYLEMMRKMSIPVDWTKYKATKLKYYESPVSFLRNANQNVKSTDNFFLNDGTVVSQNNSRDINEQLKNTIRKYNNPVDLDKAIQYP